jgi:hypothetical protein
VNGLQWVYLLLHQGVKPENIWFWLPLVDDCTVKNPRPSLDGPFLLPPPLPPANFYRGTTNPDFFVGSLHHFFASSFIDRVVWIFLDHGSETSLTFPSGELRFERLFGFATKCLG